MFIKNLGNYIENNSEGYILNDLSIDHINQVALITVFKIVRIYQELFQDNLHSVYVRGSIAKGMSLDEILDIDIFGVLKEPITDSILEQFENSIQQLSLNIDKDIEAGTIDLATLRNSEVGYYRSFEIKTQSFCVWGNDLSDSIQNYRPTSELARDIVDDIPSFILRARSKLESTIDELNIEKLSNWIGKRLLRNAFLIVMERVGRFTRDLYPCYESLCEFYPENCELFEQLLKLSVIRSSDKLLILSILGDFEKWYSQEFPKFINS